jgi:AcrR family transcriptional regulator
MSATTQRRPGGRSSRVRAAAISATLAELAENGYAGLSLERVARRAGVNKTSLYRRWGSREQLVLEAMLERAGEHVSLPDTGSLRDDLLALASAGAATASAAAGNAVVRAVAAAGPHDEALAAANARFWSERLEMDAEIVRRAVARGEAPEGIDAKAVIEAVLGPVYFRLIVTGEPPDREFIVRIADMVAAGVRGPEV